MPEIYNAAPEDTRIKYEQVYMIHYMGDILIAHPDRAHLQTPPPRFDKGIDK